MQHQPLPLLNHLCPVLFCKIQVIFRERVLGVVAASHHAPAAVTTACTRRSLSAEIWVWDGDTSLPEECTDVRGAEGVTHAAGLRHLLEDEVRFPQFGVARRAEHALRRLKMRTQHLAPFHRLVPRGRGKGFVGWDFEHVGVAQASAADSRSVQDHHAFEQLICKMPCARSAGSQRYFQNCQLDVAKSRLRIAFPFRERGRNSLFR
jgi:hypothetical protein